MRQVRQSWRWDSKPRASSKEASALFQHEEIRPQCSSLNPKGYFADWISAGTTLKEMDFGGVGGESALPAPGHFPLLGLLLYFPVPFKF